VRAVKLNSDDTAPNDGDGPPNAAGNDALPPQSTTAHSAADIPLHV